MITKKDSNGKVTGYVVRWRNPAGMLPRQPKRTFKKSQKQLAERFLATVSFRLSAGEAGLAIESPLSLREFYEQTFLPRREKETDQWRSRCASGLPIRVLPTRAVPVRVSFETSP